MTTSPSPNSNPLLDAQAVLRLALPISLLVILVGRWSFRAFIAMAERLQSQGWQPDEDDDYEPVPSAAANGDGEDDIQPVVVKIKTQRRRLILALFWLLGASFAADGVAQIIYTLVTNVFTPSQPLYRQIIVYSLGGLAAFALTAISMTIEEQQRKKPASWGRIYPRAIAVVALGLEIAMCVVSTLIIQREPNARPNVTPLPAIHLGLVSLRLLLLTALLLVQTPIFYAANYVPKAESASLLGNGYAATSYGTATDTAPKRRSALRSSRPPNNRPPDPKSLSLLTMFSRIRLLFPYLWPSKSLSLQILALCCVGIMLLKRVVNVAVPFLFGRIISDLSHSRSPYLNILWYSIASFLRDSATMLQRFLWLPIEQYSEREMNSLSFDTLLSLSLSYHTKRKTGELLRILSRTDAINNFFETLLFTFLPVIIDLPVAAVVLGVRYGPVIVSIVAGVSVLYVATSVSLAESRTRLYRRLRDEGQFMHQIKTDVLFNYETVKALTSEQFETNRLRHAMRVYQRGYFQVYSAWNSLSLVQDSLSSFGFILCSFILAHRVVSGQLDVGSYATFVTYLAQIYGPLSSLAGLYRTVMNNLVDTEQMISLLSEPKDVVDRPGATELVVSKGEGGAAISFKNVVFSYDGKKDTLRGLSFDVKPGHSVALVGPSGAGKTTIMRLLYRFYDIDANAGSIEINGHDIRDVTQLSLRRAIGLVAQDAVAFNETVRFNIAYGGGPSTTDEQIVEAAKVAQLHDRIMSFPDQYETRVGERGQRLSGGERQRLAIARVVLKDPPILTLDEATSSLDTHNERMIQTRLKELGQGRTTLSIAHRLSTVVDCDVIHVLNEGIVAESGTHHELLALGGIYADLWQKQIEAQEGAESGTATPRTEIAKEDK